MTVVDFSTAFDTVDTNIIIRRLKYEYGVVGFALNWFKSHLNNRISKVKINNKLPGPQSNDSHFGLLRAQYCYLIYTCYMLKTLKNSREP